MLPIIQFFYTAQLYALLFTNLIYFLQCCLPHITKLYKIFLWIFFMKTRIYLL